MNLEEVLLTIIACAGDSRCCSLEAIELAKESKYSEAEEKLEKASENLIEAHKAHTQILSESARRADYRVTFILVHASNNLAQAETSLDMAKTFVYLIKEIKGDI